MKYLIFLSLILSYVKSSDISCYEYNPFKNIKECFSHETEWEHKVCCGVSIKDKYGQELSCIPVPNTKAGKDIYKKITELDAKKNHL